MNKINSSFRDPAGFIYEEQGAIFRKINPVGFSDYDFFINSGLYDFLIKKKFIISHEEISKTNEEIILKPEKIPFISYPFEWCFSQYKDAALLTLEIQKAAINFGMSLKDASAYNVQFYNGHPIFIDTLSFKKLDTGKPWSAYRQFCQHFLSPLALMSHSDIRLQKLMITYIDGIPLDLTAKILPKKTKLKLGLYTHIHLHARYQKKYENITVADKKRNVSTLHLKALIDNLESSIKKLKYPKINTEWGEYYSFTNYEDNALQHKRQLISSFLDHIAPKTLIDFGGNDGSMTRLATQKNVLSISCDIDPMAVEKNYLSTKKNNDHFMLPLIQDLTNPSSNLGWQNEERSCFSSRMKTDCAMVLALIHHLAISNNIPFEQIASYLAEEASNLIIEFIPKNDSMVKKLLATRKDIFEDYTIENFEKSFSQKFKIIYKEKIEASERTLYLMKRL